MKRQESINMMGITRGTSTFTNGDGRINGRWQDWGRRGGTIGDKSSGVLMLVCRRRV